MRLLLRYLHWHHQTLNRLELGLAQLAFVLSQRSRRTAPKNSLGPSWKLMAAFWNNLAAVVHIEAVQPQAPAKAMRMALQPKYHWPQLELVIESKMLPTHTKYFSRIVAWATELYL